jgi:NTE family protein
MRAAAGSGRAFDALPVRVDPCAMRTGLVLGGGSARGAYEAGVVSYIRTELARELGHQVRLDVLAGTSVGALNASYIAGTAHAPELQAKGIVETWRQLKIDEILQFGYGDIFRVLREFLGNAPIRWDSGLTGGLVNPQGLLNVVAKVVPWRQVSRNIKHGQVHALAMAATHVATGQNMIFLHRTGGGAPPWTRDPNTAAMAVRIGPKHALASAALPVIFPSVRVGGHLFVDGGLRHNLPLSPALRLGAERVIIVPLRHQPSPGEVRAKAAMAQRETHVGSAPFLLGKTMNALLLDSTDQDIDRLDRINAMIEAGTAVYGPSFVDTLNSALVPLRNQPVRAVRRIVVRPSTDIGQLAAEYIRSAEFKKRVSGRMVGRVIARLAEREGGAENDLVSYLLFDGGFADQLIQMGYADARAQKAEWLRFFAEERQGAASSVA